MFLPWARILVDQAAARVGAQGRVVGLDLNPAMLAVARGVSPPAGATIDWREGDATSLPFSDASFDVVLCQHGLQFVPDRAAAVREMRRVLAPGGRALVMVLQSLAQHPVFEALMQSVARQLSLPLAATTIPFALSDAGQVRSWFTAAGFASVDIVPASITVRFPDPERFVPLAVASSAAAVPAFAQLEAPARAALLQTVRVETDSVVGRYRDGDVVTFPMFANVAVGVA